MNWKEITSRLNGVSCPVFGISWTPTTPDVQVARKVIRFLEDRRILYNDYRWEVARECTDSALEIRKFLTSELGNLKDGSELVAPLRAMRAACRKFLDDVHLEPDPPWHRHPWLGRGSNLFSALGELRAAFGMQIAMLAVQYGIDIEDDLARILPVEDSGT